MVVGDHCAKGVLLGLLGRDMQQGGQEEIISSWHHSLPHTQPILCNCAGMSGYTDGLNTATG